MKVVPAPALDVTSIVPLCSSMSFLVTSNPSPVPFIPFVLKNDEKIFDLISSVIPAPLSSTSNLIMLSSSRVVFIPISLLVDKFLLSDRIYILIT